MIKKYTILFLGLVVSAPLYGETVKDALSAQGKECLEIINTAAIYPFQEKKRTMLNKQLDQNLQDLTPQQVKDLATSLADFATVVVKPVLKPALQDNFSTLVQQVRAQLEALATKETAAATEAAHQQRNQTKKSDDFFSGFNFDFDTVPHRLKPQSEIVDPIDQLSEDVKLLNQMSQEGQLSKEETSSVVTEFIEKNHDVFEKLLRDELARHERLLSFEEYQELLTLFFENLGLTPHDYESILLTFAMALLTLQTELGESLLSLPLHPNLQRTVTLDNGDLLLQESDDLLLQTDSDDAQMSAEIEALNAEIEAMTNRLTKKGNFTHKDFITLGSAFEFAEIKQMLADHLRTLIIEEKEIADQLNTLNVTEKAVLRAPSSMIESSLLDQGLSSTPPSNTTLIRRLFNRRNPYGYWAANSSEYFTHRTPQGSVIISRTPFNPTYNPKRGLGLILDSQTNKNDVD